jgi:hypothetical protein
MCIPITLLAALLSVVKASAPHSQHHCLLRGGVLVLGTGRMGMPDVVAEQGKKVNMAAVACAARRMRDLLRH